MKWIVATVGAVIVTIGALLALLLAPALVVPALYQTAIGLVALYVVAFPLAITAGMLSFRATLRQYATK